MPIMHCTWLSEHRESQDSEDLQKCNSLIARHTCIRDKTKVAHIQYEYTKSYHNIKQEAPLPRRAQRVRRA